MRFSKCSDIGKVRKNNEDNVGAWPELGLFVVADGMGGHQAGEVASKIAVDTLEDFFRKAQFKPTWAPKSTLEEAITEANEKIYLLARQHKEMRGMGTTITVGYLKDNKLLIGHVGDSRAYRSNSQGLVQLTEDHSLVNELFKLGGITEEEVNTHPQRNVLTRALGVDIKVVIDFYDYELLPADYVLFCSDGLSGLVCSEEIQNIISLNMSLEDKITKLKDAALDKGGNDNISMILVEVN